MNIYRSLASFIYDLHIAFVIFQFVKAAKGCMFGHKHALLIFMLLEGADKIVQPK